MNGNATITVNLNAEVDLNNSPLQPGAAAVAVSNGDGRPHSIILARGRLVYDHGDELVVGMGLMVQGGELFVDPTLGPGLLHFTGTNSDGKSLIVCCGGQIDASGNLKADGGGEFYDAGSVTEFRPGTTLTLGVNANSAVSNLDGGKLILQNATLVAHGGFTVNGGSLQAGEQTATINLDAGNVFTLAGGELDVTEGVNNVAKGKIIISGSFAGTGGKIVNNVNSSNGQFLNGTFKVNGNVNLSAAVFLSSVDLNMNPPVVAHTWDLFDWSGLRTGMLTWQLPARWTGNAPDDILKELTATEP